MSYLLMDFEIFLITFLSVVSSCKYLFLKFVGMNLYIYYKSLSRLF